MMAVTDVVCLYTNDSSSVSNIPIQNFHHFINLTNVEFGENKTLPYVLKCCKMSDVVTPLHHVLDTSCSEASRDGGKGRRILTFLV